jgi:nicotinamidase-related amidase
LYAGQRQEITMESYVYGEKKALPVDFTEYFDPAVTAIVSIDMHEGHLADTPDCPCPGPRAREVVEPMNAFHREARKFGVPVIHVRSVCRTGGVDDIKGLKAAWRLTMPLAPLGWYPRRQRRLEISLKIRRCHRPARPSAPFRNVTQNTCRYVSVRRAANFI